MGKLRVGIIGAGGGISRQRTGHFAENRSTQVVAFASRTLEKAQAAAEERGARAVATWQELVADPEVDAVSIATPNAQHFALAMAALEHGKHTCVDYPLCQSLDQADELKALADAKGVVLHHGLNVRCEPLYLQTLEQLPRIGDIANARITYYGGGKWYIKPALVGNPFLALHIHFIDYFRGWFGEVKSLVATQHAAGEGEGYMHSGTILMQHENCAASYIEFGMGYPESPAYAAQILGSKGLIVKGKGLTVTVDGQTTTVDATKKNALQPDSENFIAQVVEGADPLRSWEDGRRTLALCLDCTRSAQTGDKITC